MKNNEDKSMIERVHKTVRRMLSEAREVIKLRTKVPPLLHNHPFLQEMPPIPHIRPNAHPLQRYRKTKTKERPYSLVLEEGALMRGSMKRREET